MDAQMMFIFDSFRFYWVEQITHTWFQNSFFQNSFPKYF